ncbi:MAG: SRPBCC family protein [Dehalococcoidia bacterium]|jgi:carbon monoxide dehydrogenase subunit G|uniref:SRPBCC family protein n=1 Tax=Pseudonocardia sp. TaxID=60912 RepID=UPI003D14CD4C
MKLENAFSIPVPVGSAWSALNDPVLIAPCFPGAVLSEYEGDRFDGAVKVKLGPISMKYGGSGTYLERDRGANRVVIEASGSATQGNSTAKAVVTITLAEVAPDKTDVSMVTDLTLTGRPAQFGRGVVVDVADRIVGQFADCVAGKLAGPAPHAEKELDRDEPAADTSSPHSVVQELRSGSAAGSKPGGAAAGEIDVWSMGRSMLADAGSRMVRNPGGTGFWWAAVAAIAAFALGRRSAA